MVFGENALNGVSPFEDDEGVGVFEGFGEVVTHEAWVGEAVEIVVDEFVFSDRGGFSVGCAILTRAPFVSF